VARRGEEKERDGERTGRHINSLYLTVSIPIRHPKVTGLISHLTVISAIMLTLLIQLTGSSSHSLLLLMVLTQTPKSKVLKHRVQVDPSHIHSPRVNQQHIDSGNGKLLPMVMDKCGSNGLVTTQSVLPLHLEPLATNGSLFCESSLYLNRGWMLSSPGPTEGS
jgi:hypothetical protein